MHQVLKTPCRYCNGEARIQEVLDEDRYTILGMMAKCTACGIRTPVLSSVEAARTAWERTPPMLATTVRAMPYTAPQEGQGSRRASLFPERGKTLRSTLREHLRRHRLSIKTDLSAILDLSPNGTASLMTKPTAFAPRHVERIIERLGLNNQAAFELRLLGAIEAGWNLEALLESTPPR